MSLLVFVGGVGAFYMPVSRGPLSNNTSMCVGFSFCGYDKLLPHWRNILENVNRWQNTICKQMCISCTARISRRAIKLKEFIRTNRCYIVVLLPGWWTDRRACSEALKCSNVQSEDLWTRPLKILSSSHCWPFSRFWLICVASQALQKHMIFDTLTTYMHSKTSP